MGATRTLQYSEMAWHPSLGDGFRVIEFRELRLEGVGFRARVEGIGFRVQGWGLGVSGSGFQVEPLSVVLLEDHLCWASWLLPQLYMVVSKA